MSAKSEQRRAVLRENLIAAAEKRIAANGLASLRARDLAQDAGCAVGAIYNAFEDLDAIVMGVNGNTFKRLGTAVSASFTGQEPPVERLILMSNAYLAFAAQETNLWRALFDLRMTDDETVPEWYRLALGRLFSLISEPLVEIDPGMSAEEAQLLTRALFSAVHGIVLLGLENRISGVPPEQIEHMIALVLSRLGNK